MNAIRCGLERRYEALRAFKHWVYRMIISKGGLLKTYKTAGEGRLGFGLADWDDGYLASEPFSDSTAPNKSGFWVLNIRR